MYCVAGKESSTGIETVNRSEGNVNVPLVASITVSFPEKGEGTWHECLKTCQRVLLPFFMIFRKLYNKVLKSSICKIWTGWLTV